MRQAILTTIAIMLLLGSAFSAEVKNDSVRQEGNRVVVTYDLEGKEEDAEVSLTIKMEGKTYSEKDLHVEGDIGKVKAGKSKKIYWNVLQDFPRGLSKDVSIEVAAGGKAFKDSLTGMEFVFVKGGCYQMGDTFGDGESDEKPVHEVCVNDFYIGKYEVTQGQWKAVMGNNPSYFKDCGDNCPVEQASWNDIQDFISKLNQKTKNNPQAPFAKGEFRLPTEAEWEYAARSGGKTEKYAGTSNESELGNYAWYDKNSSSKTHPVGTKSPNGLGLYDMSGNVWEWVNDWYSDKYYGESPKNNPKGPSSGSLRVLRGGRWYDVAGSTRTTGRFGDFPDYRDNCSGLRLVRTQ